MGFIAAARNSGNGLGDYFDGTNTWHFDQATGVYVDQNGNPNPADPIVQQQQTTQQTAEPATWDALVGQYGSAPNASGGYTYTASSNPYLQTSPTNTGSAGVTQAMNPNFYATREAAEQFAAALGGTVVLDPQLQIGGSGSPIYAVRLPDGTTANAGAIAMILGNDAAYGNTAVKSGEIAKLFGAAYDPGIAEALVSGGSVDLQAGLPAPGYLPTPLSQSAITAAAKATTITPQQRAAITSLPPLSPLITTGSPLDSTLKVLNDKLSQFTTKETADSITASLLHNWALWLAAAVAAYLLLRRQQNQQ